MTATRGDLVHVVSKGVICDTEGRGFETPGGRRPVEIVVDASEGSIPLWAQGSVLGWRFQERSFAQSDDPEGRQRAVTDLLAEALLQWGAAAPVKFTRRADVWDFEIVLRNAPDCRDGGCVLASAFFPDAGRHQLVIYPTMFEQPAQEQVETLVHELGHVFGLRHFFAQVSEQQWPSEIFGTHSKFSIMNYGPDSKLTPEDLSDLTTLYQQAWSGALTDINGAPIRFVRPFSAAQPPAPAAPAA